MKNCRVKNKERETGWLTTEEIEPELNSIIEEVQRRHENTERFCRDRDQLNLVRENGLYFCKGRIQGMYPIYIPPDSLLAEKIVADAHKNTLHGLVGLTMTKVRQRYWIPKLRQLTKGVIRRCYGCKKYRAIALKPPPTAPLPKDRTEGTRPFQVIGVDFAGPIMYRIKGKQDGKAYIILYACSLSRALYLETLPSQSLGEFLKSLKRFVARRGRPNKIYSDNGSTFVAASKWLKKILKSEALENYLSSRNIRWQFNLSRAPWWGGHYERLIGIVKRSLHKTVGRAKLTLSELEEVLLDVETILNNRPLSYVEDDIQMPILTPNSLMYDEINALPNESLGSDEDSDLRKRAKYLKRCKENVWKRWRNEYLSGLRERHTLIKGKKPEIQVGDIMMIKGEEKNRGQWKIGIVDRLIAGKDEIVRGVRLRAGKTYLERAVQQLYPLELSCDWNSKDSLKEESILKADDQLNQRPKRNSSAIARLRIQDELANEESMISFE